MPSFELTKSCYRWSRVSDDRFRDRLGDSDSFLLAKVSWKISKVKTPLGSFVASISLKEILLGVTSGSNLPELVNRWTLGPQAIVQWSLAASWLPPRTGKVGSDSKFKLIQPKITPKKTSESQRSDFISFYLISNISFPYFLLKSMMFKPLPTLPATCVPVPERVSLSSAWQLHTKKHPVLIHHWPSVRTKITATLQGTI